MNYSQIFYDDTVNGNGFRTSLFVSGCSKTPKCKDCWNPLAWNFNFGNELTSKEYNDIIYSMEKPYTSGLSILGGEPMDNLKDGTLLKLVKEVKRLYPNKTIYCWTGYKFEDLIKREECFEFLQYVDMLRDGEFILELRNLNQYLQGSSNQRYVDVRKTLEKGEYVKYSF